VVETSSASSTRFGFDRHTPFSSRPKTTRFWFSSREGGTPLVPRPAFRPAAVGIEVSRDPVLLFSRLSASAAHGCGVLPPVPTGACPRSSLKLRTNRWSVTRLKAWYVCEPRRPRSLAATCAALETRNNHTPCMWQVTSRLRRKPPRRFGPFPIKPVPGHMAIVSRSHGVYSRSCDQWPH